MRLVRPPSPHPLPPMTATPADKCLLPQAHQTTKTSASSVSQTRSIVDDEDVAEKDTDTLPEVQKEEDEYDFYTRQFQDFISIYSPLPSLAPVSAPAPARPDSIILSPEVAPKLPAEAPKPRETRGPTHAHVPPPPPPTESRPPRMAIPSDLEDDISFEEEEEPARAIVIEKCGSTTKSIYSQPSFVPAQDNHPVSPAVPETPMSEMYLPHVSTDSDASRSSLDSFSSSLPQSHSSLSFSSEEEERTPISPSHPTTRIRKQPINTTSAVDGAVPRYPHSLLNLHARF
ncbi:hypothetical protein EDB19DRAFT_1917795 [Suillus lakei]|nr:hypothetical protein EDB19DRAFT_1917795 [Suillus lakei]